MTEGFELGVSATGGPPPTEYDTVAATVQALPDVVGVEFGPPQAATEAAASVMPIHLITNT
ncbi:MAG TPA: hypothetical protein VFL67_10905 [Mycobacterium sp.]|nr:hypothetical protein [Mycobacterium sp.]